MSYLKRIIGAVIFISAVFAFSVCFAAAQEQTIGTPRIDYRDIQQSIDKINDALRIETLDISFDDELEAVVDDIYDASKFDVNVFIGNIPDVFAPKRTVTKAMNLPVEKVQNKLNDFSEKLENKGLETSSTVVKLTSIAAGSPESLTITGGKPDKNNASKLYIKAEYCDGRSELIDTGSVYDREKGIIYAPDGTGVFGLGYDMDVKNYVLYTRIDVWMRSLGFCRAYDILANAALPSLYDFDTVRLKFNYDNTDWMIQMWKGKYYVTNGVEIGIYNKPVYRLVEFYDCAGDEDLLEMSIKATTDEGEVIVDRDLEYHWWMNGFSINDRYYDASELTIETELVMKDKEMLAAFVEALDKETDVLSYSVDGLKVSIIW